MYKVMKYRKIFIKYNVYLKKLYFTCEFIKSCISHVKIQNEMGYVDFREPTSDFQTPTTFLLSYFLNWISRNSLVIKWPGFDEIFIFFTPTPVVSVLEVRRILCNIIINVTSYNKEICNASKLYKVKRIFKFLE